jgi:thiol-disulfide isomerase/thioredoxin
MVQGGWCEANTMNAWKMRVIGPAVRALVGLTPVALLGLSILLLAVPGCDWFEAQPEENLPPQTTLISCGPAGGVLAGGDVTLRWTGTDVDGEITSYQWSYDQLDWEDTDAESTVIEDIALGNHTFEVRAVDNAQDADPDPAHCAFAAGEMVDRTVLVEFLTTNTCKNCPTAEAALDELLTEYGRGKLAVIAYHDLTAMDGLATDETVARIDYYTASDIDPRIPENQWPIAIFDGLRTVEGAVSVEQAVSEYGYEISQRIAVGSPVRLSVTGDIGAEEGSIEVGARVTGVLSGHPLVMRLAVIEDDVRYNGYFAKIFDAVARDLLDDEPLTLEAIGDSVAVQRTFPAGEGWTLDNMDVIALIQDTETREIVQAARLRHD